MVLFKTLELGDPPQAPSKTRGKHYLVLLVVFQCYFDYLYIKF